MQPDLCDCEEFLPLEDDGTWCARCDHSEVAHVFGAASSWCEYDYNPPDELVWRGMPGDYDRAGRSIEAEAD